ncbi:E3 ubiquitin-protein ligase RNF213 isoform X2 [Ambystoma mexicanum]
MEVDREEEKIMDAPGELRVDVPTASEVVEDDLLHSEVMGTVEEKIGTSLPVPSIADNPILIAQKKKKKKNRKRKHKNPTSGETESLASKILETAPLTETNVYLEQVESTTSLESEAGSMLHEASGNLMQVERQVLLTSSNTVTQRLVDSMEVESVTEDGPPKGSDSQVTQSAAPMTESSPGVCGSIDVDPCNFPMQEEGPTTTSLAGKVEECKNTADASPATQLVENEKTCGLAPSTRDLEKPIQVSCAAQKSYATALIKGNHGKSVESMAVQTQDQRSVKVISKTEIQREETKTCPTSPKKVQGTKDVREEKRACRVDLSMGKVTSENEKFLSEQVGSDKNKQDQAKSEKNKGGHTISEKAKGEQAISEKEGGGWANYKKEKESQNCYEKETECQANVEKKLSKKERKKAQKSAEQTKASTDNQESKNVPPANEPKNKTQSGPYKRSQNIGDSVMVYFHAILSNDFKFDLDKHKVVIRASGISGYNPWREDVCEMNFSKNLNEHGMLFEGLITVAKKDLNKYIPYKYCVVRNGKWEYEFIYKPDVPDGIMVNRCFRVPEVDISQGEWHQYDDIVCVKPDQGFLKKFKSWVGLDSEKRKLLNGKEIAGEIMLDCIFNLLTTLDSTNLKNFLTQLNHFYLVSSNPMVDENGPKQWSSLPFGQTQVVDLITKALNKVAKPFLSSVSTRATPGNVIVEKCLAAGLIVLIVGETYKLPASKEQLTKLCRLLCLQEMPRHEALAELESLRDVFSFYPKIKQCLVNLCRSCIDERTYMWIAVLPILHFFTSSLDPEQPSLPSLQMQQEDMWAGLEGFEFDTLRSNPYDKRTLLQLMKSKRHLLEVDRSLGRSWFALMPMELLAEFLSGVPVNLLDALVGTYYRLRDGLIGYMNYKTVQDILETLLRIMELPDNRTHQQEAAWIALRIHSQICKNMKEVRFYEIPTLTASVFFKVAKVTSSEELNDVLVNTAQKQTSVAETLKDVLKTTQIWLHTVLNRNLPIGAYLQISLMDELKVWDRFVNIIIPCKQLADLWRTSLLSDLEGRIKQEGAFQQIEVYCKHHDIFSQFQSDIGKCFENCAIEAVHSACQGRNDILGKLSSYDLYKFGRLLSEVITKSWPASGDGRWIDDFDRVLEHLHSWPGVKHIFKLYGADGQLLVELTDDAKTLMVIADSVFMAVHRNLMNGTLLVKHLECILKNKDHFLTIWKLAQNRLLDQKQGEENQVKQVLKWREDELMSLKRERDWVDSLLKMCRNVEDTMKVDTGDLERIHFSDLGMKAMDEIVEVKLLGSPNVSAVVAVTYYNLCPDDKEMAEQLHNFKDSGIFNLCWEREARFIVDEAEDNPNGELTLEELNDNLFYPCFKQYQDIYKNLVSGELTFKVVDDIFKSYKDHYEELTKELRMMCCLAPTDHGKWVDLRVQQIEQYYQLHLAIDSAKVIAEVKKELNLSGDFKILETLLTFGNGFVNINDQTISCITQQLMQARHILAEITEDRRLCLELVTQRKEFIAWVKEALEDINELKVFVDLASISAGENDMDVDRVACFHDAVLGYSCLLYELDAESGFQELMQCLKKLWKALENDEKLPKKLEDSARHLQWLKTVKESHGSVELSSLSLATSINSKGIYLIRAPRDDEKISPDTVLRLTLPESHGDYVEQRDYCLEELKELLNKLMLMSGKGNQRNEEVEMFSEVHSDVHRLAVSFIDLHSAGNALFRKWEAKLYCSSESDIAIKMDFNLPAIGKIDIRGKLTELLPIICKRMEFFLDRWKYFMEKKRTEHYYLNYYTAEQLFYLCQQFELPDISKEALMMLSFIQPGCTKYDVMQLVLERKGLSLRNRIPDFSVSQGKQDPERGKAHSSLGKQVSELKMSLEKEGSISKKLDLIWDCYMACMSTLVPGCLDIETLGRSLSLLVVKAKCINRTLPPSLLTCRPNLILCPPAEILTSALAIYAHSPDKGLPTYDEVLLCTAGTTYEQVELFLRRCLTPGCLGQKIYTALFADELSYDVGYRAEQLFQKLQSEAVLEYRLVLLCNSQKEHSYIPSVFSQYKVHVVPQQSAEKVQEYLCKHFTVASKIPSAAAMFKNRSCVGIVTSNRAGVGKSLYVKRLHKKLIQIHPDHIPLLKTIRMIDASVDESKVLRSLLPFLSSENEKRPIIFHFDITSSVQRGISEFLFKLFVLQYLMDTDGKMWKRNPYHLYVVEILEPSVVNPKKQQRNSHGLQYRFLDVITKVTCCAPKEVLQMETENLQDHIDPDPGMDHEEFCSDAFQRPYQYLFQFNQGQNLDKFQYITGSVQGTTVQCLQLLLMYCGILDPTWSELRNFAWFLNLQLKDCESSLFCNPDFVGDTLQGFKNFVVNFMILMAKDFATPSLSISDQSTGRQTFNLDEVTDEDLAPFLMRKKWESEPHPYIFFNADHESMTFIGFHLQPNSNGGVDAINPVNGKVIKSNIMTIQLYQGLQLQRVPFNVDFDSLKRHEKIEKLCMVLGINWPLDPDDTYELTTDNVLKILAIQMRFRCGIPVIIMGETGCGKTRLIKYLCELHKSGVATENMKLVKVHGGTTADMIYTKIQEAEAIAVRNKLDYSLDTVLFFDEANTTEAVSSIKEVLCDRTVEGKPLSDNTGLHIIAACNPYRKHTPEMIKRLESAGLGYRVKADETRERLGSIPLRQLVYRVHCLPPSMVPLVWDFGQLNNDTERMYVHQIVQRLAPSIKLSASEVTLLTNVFYVSQSYMRQRNDECSFVSLRDVERCVEVFKWFFNHSELLIINLQRYLENNNMPKHAINTDKVLWSLVLAVGVCYHASLERKDEYRKVLCKLLPVPYEEEKNILQDITLVQDLFLSGARLRETIARNLALKENVFMMVICIELKIPLFLVGKPGSSKSLAKTIVADAMQGQASRDDLYRQLKQIHLVSFQCSPHSTPEGIIGTFNHCARFQKGKNLEEYVSVVVLDEIGLAEDSPKMPLKTLHPLLEDGCIDDEPHPYKKVGFIGISNWALDPAKMNRGIFVCRGDPDRRELIESAKGICCENDFVHQRIKNYFSLFADAYKQISKTQKRQKKEFFGLRDYYSLIKMVFASTKSSQKEPTTCEIVQAVLRNFSGKDDINALSIFKTILRGERYPDSINTIDLVWQNIYSDDGECRYLLVLTKNYAALQILQQTFFKDRQQPEIIFGSSFPKDQEYTQICRNINRVKICMETGQMVILLNLQNLYESLYDALNQYYVYLAGQKYVDLGLGTHRVKCRVHSHFRLIVIEEKDIVYKQFPIPLINRLEKHYLDINTVLTTEQRAIAMDVKKWVKDFTDIKTEQLLVGQQTYSPSDVFIGYHSDTCASVILQVTEKMKRWLQDNDDLTKVVEEAKTVLLNCATPDSVIRLSSSKLGSFVAKQLAQEYFKKQKHNSLGEFLYSHISTSTDCCATFTEITTFSRLLTSADTKNLQSEVQDRVQSISVLSLQQFDTEYSFLKEIRTFFGESAGSKVLIIQTDFENGSQSAHLIASAKYSAVNEINKVKGHEAQLFVYFITKLSRLEGESSYVGFHGGLWQSVHIDDLRKAKDMVSDVTALQHLKISELFSTCKKRIDQFETMSVDSKSAESAVAEMEILMETEGDSEMYMESEPDTTIKAGEEKTEADISSETEVDILSDMEVTAEEQKPTDEETLADADIRVCPGLRRHSSEIEARDILDTTTLIRSCVQSAVGMLRDENELSARSTRRIEILLSLLSQEDELRAAFLGFMKERLFDLLKKQEDSSMHASEWVIKEASNPDALHEAGTFRHTLWRRIQAVTTPFLAHVVSVIDRDFNLEILFDSETCPGVKNLWIFIFSDLKLLSVPYTMTGSSSQSETILVQNYMKLPESVHNTMPFSWRIKDYLEELYSQAQYIRNQEGAEKFVEIFLQTPLGVFISGLSEIDRHELFLRYVRDFLLLNMSVSSPDELQFLQMALLSCITDLKESQVMKDEMAMCLPWVHLAYHHFMHRLQNFSRILAVNPGVLETLTMKIEEVQTMTRHEMALDVFAAVACTEMLAVQVLKPSAQDWLRLVKNLQMPLEVICIGSYLQGRGNRCQKLLQQVRTGWNCILSMALFVEHVLLGVKSQEPQLLKLVKEHTAMLGKCLSRNSDIKTERPFTAVIEVLRKCREEASSVFSRFGLQWCPVCLGDPEPPILLPCDHMYCEKCINCWLTQGEMNCPFCRTQLPDDYIATVSEELSGAIEKNAHFRGLCNSFFIDLVSTLCFKDNVPPDNEVILQLLSLLFVNKELCDAIAANQAGHTKSLSPFDDSVDKNPVIRSVILKLLLKYSFDDVKIYIQKYLSGLQENNILEKDDKTEMYALFVNCLEDSMYEKIRTCIGSEKLTHLKNESHFLEQCLQLNGHNASHESSIEYLQEVARIRLYLDTAAELLFHLHSDTGNIGRNQINLGSLENFCKKANNDWFRVYLVRKLTNQYGMEFVQKLFKNSQFGWVFPPEIVGQQKDQICQIDLFLVCGDGYRILRDALGTAIIECKTEGIKAAQTECRTSKREQSVHLILAVFRELTLLYGSQNNSLHPKPAQCEVVSQFIQESRVLESRNLKEFALSLVANDHPTLSVSPGLPSSRSTVIEMLVHTAAVLLCGRNPILEPLKNFAFSPENMQNAYFPTMPADLLIDAVNVSGLTNLKWYQCPNGHYCAIGECGQPMQVSRCVDCGAAIGGTNHQPEQGFQIIQHLQDRTQTGHILGDPRNRDGVVAPDRPIAPAAFILLRLLTHLAMALGVEKDHQKVLLGAIKPPVQDLTTFLQGHIEKDLEQLRNTLGKSADETTNVVHLILCSLRKEQHQNQWPVGFDGTLSTKQSRDTWEKIVATTVINPEIQNLEKRLLEVNFRISQDKRISSNPVVKIVYGDPKTFLTSLPTKSHVHCSRIWSCRKRISIEYLWHVAQQKDGKDTVPILWRFLQKDAELRLVKFLPEILALQRDLVKKFQNCTDVDSKKIAEFLNTVRSDGMKLLFKGRIEKFLTAWNQLRPSLDTNGEIKLPKGSCDAILTMESDFEILLPRRRGLGLCATALVSYLISLHNDFVYTVEKYTNENGKYSVSPSEVSELHVISYEVEKDLIPIILSNCQYSVESGGEILQELDLEKIQRQVTSRFLQGKPIIAVKGIPTLVYRQDRNYENTFADIKSKLHQDILSNSMINTISGELHSYSDICEALSLTDVVLGFLATAGGESDQPLVQYVEDVLKMGDQTSALVLEALSRCHLKHTIALWQLLTARKSEHLIRLKRDPFVEVAKKYKDTLADEDVRQLNAFLAHASLDTFLLELHEMILLKLKRSNAVGEFNPSWSLYETLGSYIETKREEPYVELEDLFPQEILLSQCVEAWKAAAAMRRDRQK